MRSRKGDIVLPRQKQYYHLSTRDPCRFWLSLQADLESRAFDILLDEEQKGAAVGLSLIHI